MEIIELFLIGIGLSMDAFAVAVCKGLSMNKISIKNTGLIALFFGGFQAIMPLIGWLLGKQFEKYITSFDHWIAVILLAFLGGKMILESMKKQKEGTIQNEVFKIKELFILSIATSIDALAVGITFSFLKVNIFGAVTIIGITTFLLSVLGVIAGNRFGSRYEKKAEFAGGIILIFIGLKILLEHLEVITI